MSVVRNLRLLGKRMTKRPLSREDIYSYCAGLIKTPPMVEQGKDFFTISVKCDGKSITLAEYYRKRLLIPALDKIANALTWQLQRTVCIEAILEEIHWDGWDYGIRNAKTDLCKEFILKKIENIFPNSDRDERERTVFAFYMMNLSAGAALQTLGSAYFGIDERKAAEIKLCLDYQREFMMIDVRIMDYIGQNHMDDPETGYRIADWQDERVSKVTQKMHNLLTAMKDQIAHDIFDVARFKQKSDALEQEREDLVEKLASLMLFNAKR